MKKYLILFCFLSILSEIVQGQEEKNANIGSNEGGSEKITQIFNPFKESIYSQYDIFGLDVYWCAWNQPVNDIKTGKFSFGFNFNYFCSNR